MRSWQDPAGRFALHMRKKLLQIGVADWQRRGRTLLEINCGAGIFLPTLWECGFDISATELCPALRQRATEKIASRAEIFAASDDHLPFENNAFDWVVLHLVMPTSDAVANALQEALRVAAAGLAVTFWNSVSLPYIAYRIGGRKKSWPTGTCNWWNVWYTLKKLSAGRMSGMSTLAAPRSTWSASCPLAFCNHGFHWLPFGSWAIIRLHLAPSRPLTPLGLRLGREPMESPEPVMEYETKTP